MSDSLPINIKAGRKPTNFDILLQYYKDETGKVEISDKQQQILIRWEEAFTLLREYKTVADVVPMLMKRFRNDDGTELSKRQAYRDVRNAIRFFGDVNEASKAGLRHLMTEYCMDVITLAKVQKPPNLKQINAAIANIVRINGLDKEDPDMPDWSKLEPTIQVIQLDPSFLQKYKDVLDPKVIELLSGVLQSKQFTDYKEVIDIPFVEPPTDEAS